MAYITTIKLLFNVGGSEDVGDILQEFMQEVPDLLDWQYADPIPAYVDLPEGYVGDGTDFPSPPKGKTETKKVFLMMRTSAAIGSYMTVGLTNFAKDDPENYVLLAEKEVEFDLLKTDEELVLEQIDGLEKGKQRIRAEAQINIRKLDERIQNLLSISHQPEKAFVSEADNSAIYNLSA